MRETIRFVCCVLGLVVGLSAECWGIHWLPPKVSGRASCSLLTMTPSWRAIYTGFGHSAFRIQDPAQDLDVVFNYGVFDFRQPHFYLNYIHGKLLYRLLAQDFARFLRQAVQRNRHLSEQTLALDSTQVRALYRFLYENGRPENSQYLYNYVNNNCATQLRDALDVALDGEVHWRYEASLGADRRRSLRRLMNEKLEAFPWEYVGINLLLGSPMLDTLVMPRSYTFLPDHLETAFSRAQVRGKPLVRSRRVLCASSERQPEGGFFQPRSLFWTLFVLTLAASFFFRKRRRVLSYLDKVLFGLLGLFGFLLLYLWFFTMHTSAWNYHLLWCFPAYACIPFLHHALGRRLLYAFIALSFVFIISVTVLRLTSGLDLPLAEILPLLLIFLSRALFRLKSRGVEGARG